MPDYKNMSAKEALREAKDASGMTAESIAQGVGITAKRSRAGLASRLHTCGGISMRGTATFRVSA